MKHSAGSENVNVSSRFKANVNVSSCSDNVNYVSRFNGSTDDQ